MKAIILVLALSVLATPALAKKTYRKVQDVNFDELSLTGTVRNPDGAYLVQKRGLRFLPLYEIQKDFDRKIRQSLEYMN